jgi:hypothetical protein
MKNVKTLVALCVTVALAVGVYFVFQLQNETKVENNEASEEIKPTKKARTNRVTRVSKNGGTAIAEKAVKKAKPTFDLEDDEESKMTDEQRQLIEAIRDALDANDKTKVLKLVEKLQTSEEWPDGIPKAIKMAAIDALGWFGASGLPEIAGFLADADGDVVQAAIDKYGEALSDFDLSDFERSDVLLQAVKVITDSDAVDSMMFEINNMRHSVAVATLKDLMASENPAVKEHLQEAIDLYTSEEDITTPEQLDDWLEENPDDEWDESFYGGAGAEE